MEEISDLRRTERRGRGRENMRSYLFRLILPRSIRHTER